MNLNRRSFFRLLGRASGTAAAVVVGGAAVLPDDDMTKITSHTDYFEIDGQMCRVNHIYERTVLANAALLTQPPAA